MTDTYMVKVGTHPETAKGRYAEFAGHNFHGPFNHDEAVAFADAIHAEWTSIEKSAFVYGEPFTEILPLRSPEDEGPWTPRKIARNWHLTD